MISFLVGFPGGSLESTLKLGAIILLTYALVLWLSAIVWVYRDAKNRTADSTSQMIAVLLVAIFNVPGLIVYLVIRPQATMADAYERSLETEAVLHELQLTANSCQTCRRPIDDDFNVCPHCRTVLREGCRSCGRAIRTSWLTCPYCATDRPAPRPQPQPRVMDSQPLTPPARNPAPATANATTSDSGPTDLPPRRRPAPAPREG
jgi:RNA polymerase subunit RPABC4/transcription elongation factor Spt4